MDFLKAAHSGHRLRPVGNIGGEWFTLKDGVMTARAGHCVGFTIAQILGDWETEEHAAKVTSSAFWDAVKLAFATPYPPDLAFEIKTSLNKLAETFGLETQHGKA